VAAETNGTIAFIIHPAAIPPGTSVFIVAYVPSKSPGADGGSSSGDEFTLIDNGPLGPCTSNAP